MKFFETAGSSTAASTAWDAAHPHEAEVAVYDSGTLIAVTSEDDRGDATMVFTPGQARHLIKVLKDAVEHAEGTKSN